MSRDKRRGQALILVVVAVGLVMAGALGFAVDVGTLYFHRQMAQGAADAAAIAGVMSMFNGTNVVGATGYFSTAASFTCAVNDSKIPCKYAGYHQFGGSSSDTITVSFPTTSSGYSTTLSTTDTPNQIKVLIERDVANSFIRMFGAGPTSKIRASATAAIVQVTSPVPMIITHPSLAGALSTNGNTTLQICGGPTQSIEVNSSSNPTAAVVNGGTIDLSHAGPSDSGDCSSSSTVAGADFGVFGAPSSAPGTMLLGAAGHYLQPQAPVDDPLAPLVTTPTTAGLTVNPAPVTIASGFHGCTAVGGCTEYKPGLYNTNAGLSVNNPSPGDVIFDPGLYYVQGTGGFQLKNVNSAKMCPTSGASSCAADANTGSGMLVYDTGSGTGGTPNKTGGFDIDTNINNVILLGAGETVAANPALQTAPVAPYYGILFWENQNSDAHTGNGATKNGGAHNLGQGNGCFSLIGTVYLTNTKTIMLNDPAHYQAVTYNGNPCSGTSIQGQVIASTLSLVGSSVLKMNIYPYGFIKVRSVALVQ